jgi:WD40 repeat protein
VDVATGQEIHRLREKDRGNAIFAVCYSPDSKTVATAGQYGSIRLWDVDTGTDIRQLKGHTSRVNAMCFADGKTLVSVSNDGTVRLWDPETGKETSPVPPSRGIKCARYAQDGKTIVTASEWGGEFLIWDGATGKEVHRFKCLVPGGPSAYVEDVQFAPDGKTMIVCTLLLAQHSSSQTIGVYAWDPTAKEMNKLWETNAVTGLCYAPDGKALALSRWLSAEPKAETVLCDATTGKVIRRLEGIGTVDALTFAPKGKALITTSGGTIRLWDPATGKEIAEPLPERERDKNRFHFDFFTPDGATLATVSTPADKSPRVWDAIRLRDVASGKEVRNFQYTGSFAALAPDGKVLVSVDTQDGSLRLWEVASGKEIGRLREPLTGCTGRAFFAPDGRTLVSVHANSTVLLWDVHGLRPAGK